MISKKDRREPHVTAVERVASLLLELVAVREFQKEYPDEITAAVQYLSTSHTQCRADLLALFADPKTVDLTMAMTWGFRHAEKGHNLEHALIEFEKVLKGEAS